ncbi:MAG: crossover junction endodeoxyribonuclease RuvC, partial [Parachlamydia sp.]|nr:crossover junction endodeoxyribonuclease RuvC [Parachlamydia sp.]
IMGIDPSITASGIVILEDGKIIQAVTLPNRKDLGTISRVLDIVSVIEGLIRHYQPALIVIEGFSYASKGRSVFDTAYLGYRIREELERLRIEKNIPWIEVPPTQLKQFATGQGNAKKEIILQQVYKRWGVELHDNNQGDAFVLAQIGRAYLGQTDNLTAFQAEVIAALKGEKPAKKPRKKKVKE